MKGTVKFFNDMKGYGFVSGEDGKEYFIHLTGLKEGVTITENDIVEFDVEQGDRGPKAVNVEKATDAPAEEEPAEEEPAEEEPAEEAEEAPEEEPEEEEKKE